ncbi:PREDICTED: uncharacterized protein LOC106821122 isoform X2 [Priapulus caudatus]|nr:PREDICTED: uncharacterized protein LOC106821122 isoform X2 [Priapulus caudatus]
MGKDKIRVSDKKENKTQSQRNVDAEQKVCCQDDHLDQQREKKPSTEGKVQPPNDTNAKLPWWSRIQSAGTTARKKMAKKTKRKSNDFTEMGDDHSSDDDDLQFSRHETSANIDDPLLEQRSVGVVREEYSDRPTSDTAGIRVDKARNGQQASESDTNGNLLQDIQSATEMGKDCATKYLTSVQERTRRVSPRLRRPTDDKTELRLIDEITSEENAGDLHGLEN